MSPNGVYPSLRGVAFSQWSTALQMTLSVVDCFIESKNNELAGYLFHVSVLLFFPLFFFLSFFLTYLHTYF